MVESVFRHVQSKHMVNIAHEKALFSTKKYLYCIFFLFLDKNMLEYSLEVPQRGTSVEDA